MYLLLLTDSEDDLCLNRKFNFYY